MKIKLHTLKRILELATAKEIDFIVYTVRFADKHGVIKGITKDEICGALGVHKSKFYDILYSLEKKEVIRIDYNNHHYKYWTFKLLDNAFWEDADYKAGYINVNTTFLYTKEFLHLTKGEKVICLKLLALQRPGRGSIPLKLSTLMDWTGCKIQSIRKYIKSLTCIFKKITLRFNVVIFEYEGLIKSFMRKNKENDIYNQHEINYILGLKKASADPKDIKDTVKLFTILSKKHSRYRILEAVFDCLDRFRSLNPKYIYKMIGLANYVLPQEFTT